MTDPHQYCQEKAATSGSSFYYSFLFLPKVRRQAITALYAFCREVDDVADECSDANIWPTPNWPGGGQKLPTSLPATRSTR
jgi:phytoene synthase